MELKNNSGVPPDGRWGWVVVFGSFITNVFSQSLTFVFGFIYGTRFAELGFNQSNISLIMNLSSVCTNLSGWFLGIATEHFSLRQLSVVGSLSISFGIIISSFASTLPQFILSYAVMVGIGLGLTGSAAFLAVCSFFTMRRNRAVSFAMTGIGIGQILLPQIVTTLMPAYGSQGTILYIGALSLHSLIGAILFQPVKWHFIPNNRRLNLPSETDPLLPEKSREAINTNSSNNRNFESKAFDFDVMKDIRFFILNLGLSCGYSIIIDFVTILPFFLQQTANLTAVQTAFCLSSLASSDVISRLTFHFITERFEISCRRAYALSLIAIALTLLTLTIIRSFTMLVIACIVLGYFKAANVLNLYLSLAEYCTVAYANSKKLPFVLGMNMILKSVCVIFIGQCFGYIRDQMQNYTVTFYMQNIVISFILILWAFEYCYLNKK